MHVPYHVRSCLQNSVMCCFFFCLQVYLSMCLHLHLSVCVFECVCVRSCPRCSLLISYQGSLFAGWQVAISPWFWAFCQVGITLRTHDKTLHLLTSFPQYFCLFLDVASTDPPTPMASLFLCFLIDILFPPSYFFGTFCSPISFFLRCIYFFINIIIFGF